MIKEDWFCAALCVAWVATFWAQSVPLPNWDWRVVAAFVQAFLSAGAIFSAWWLQSQKRESDRRERVEDTITATVALSDQIETDLAFYIERCRKGEFKDWAAKLNAPIAKANADLLRAQPIGHLPDAAVNPHVAVMHVAVQVAAALDWLPGQLKPEVSLESHAFENLYERLYRNRSRFLIAVGRQPLQPRQTLAKLKLIVPDKQETKTAEVVVPGARDTAEPARSPE